MKLHASVVILEDEAESECFKPSFEPNVLFTCTNFRPSDCTSWNRAAQRYEARGGDPPLVFIYWQRVPVSCRITSDSIENNGKGVLRPRPCWCLFSRSKKWGCFWRTGKDDQEGLADQLGFGNLARTQKKLSFPGLDWLIEHHWFKWNTTIPVGTRRKSDLRYLRCLLLLLYHRLKLKLMLYSCCNVRHFVEMRPGKCSWDKRKSQDSTLCDTIHAEVHVSLENAWI